MNDIMNMLVGDLVLSPELVFCARVIVVILAVDVLANILSAIVPIVKNIR